MKKNIKRYLLSTLLVVLAVGVVDKTAGFVLDYLWHRIPVTQDMGKGQFARNEVNTDLVIIGSSRAAHHYDVNMISDSLSYSAYNLGLDGCFFLDNCCVMHALIIRYSPKIIILEIADDAMYAEAENHMEMLYNYYWSDVYVKDIVNHEEGWLTGLKLMSSLYRHNANSFKTIGYGLKGLRSRKQNDPLNGYAPIAYKEKRKELKLRKPDNSKMLTISEWKKTLLSDLLKEAFAKGIKIYVVTSPLFVAPNNINQKSKEAIDSICKDFGASYWDYSSESLFLNHPQWFNDGAHLNEVGASVFTKMIISRIQDRCK